MAGRAVYGQKASSAPREEGISKKYIELAKANNPAEPEFHQAVEEVLISLEPVLKKHPEYIRASLIERMIEPERVISFRVTWQDDKGQVNVNRGYRVQFNSAIGPYKGGLRFAPGVYQGIMKCLAFEQTFKNSLTGLPIGGAKGGSDFDPRGRSDSEIMRFCQAFMTELYRHIAPDTDVPAGDLGVGARELGYLFGQYKRIANSYSSGVLTGKGLSYGGLPGRAEATGYGICFFLRDMLEANGESIEGKSVVISGFGNVAWGTAQMLEKMGAKLIAFSGPDGYILDRDGISGKKVEYMLELRNSGKDICSPYAKKFKTAEFFKGEKPWGVKADIYIPCATQNDVDMTEAKKIVKNGCRFYCEGANMPTTNEALEYLRKNGVIIAPAKAANAGGVACSALEMSQNARKYPMEREEVYEKLEGIMKRIHDASAAASKEYGLGYDLVAGANIAGFLKIADAMMAQGYV